METKTKVRRNVYRLGSDGEYYLQGSEEVEVSTPTEPSDEPSVDWNEDARDWATEERSLATTRENEPQGRPWQRMLRGAVSIATGVGVALWATLTLTGLVHFGELILSLLR